MFCTKCGKEIPDNSIFCKNCGNQIKKIANAESEDISQISDSSKMINVTFHRQKKFTGCAVPMHIYVDKQKIATLKNDEKFETTIKSGKHKIIVEMWSAVSENEVELSSEYSKSIIEVGIKMGFFTNKAEIISIKNEK